MRNELRDTERATGVAGGGLDPQALEWSLAEEPTVADAVQRDATREHEILEPGLAVRRARHPEHDLFADNLDRAREVHLTLGQVRLRLARRASEYPLNAGLVIVSPLR